MALRPAGRTRGEGNPDGRALLQAIDTAASLPAGWLAVALDVPAEPATEAATPQPATMRHQLSAGLQYQADLEPALVALSALARAALGRPTWVMPFSVAALTRASRDWLLDVHHQPAAGDKQTDPRAQGIRNTFRAFQELDTRYGGGYARLALVQHLTANVLPLLGSASKDVQEAGAELLYLAGLMAFDDGALGLAECYLIQALRLSQEAGSRSFAANTV